MIKSLQVEHHKRIVKRLLNNYCICVIYLQILAYICLDINIIIANMKKYLQSDWLRVVQYWPYLYSVFNICTLLLKKNKNSTFDFRSGKIEMYSLKTN